MQLTSNPTLFFEAVKLVAQLSGAVIVARLTVGWALERFKSEKTWERRMAAYIEALAAIGQMEKIAGRRYDRAIECRDAPEDLEAEETTMFNLSARKLTESVISARLLFSAETSKILADLESELLNAARQDSYQEFLDHQIFALRTAKDALITDGRKVLKLN